MNEEYLKKIDDLHKAVCGDEELGIEGFVQWRKKVNANLTVLNVFFISVSAIWTAAQFIGGFFQGSLNFLVHKGG